MAGSFTTPLIRCVTVVTPRLLRRALVLRATMPVFSRAVPVMRVETTRISC